MAGIAVQKFFSKTTGLTPEVNLIMTTTGFVSVVEGQFSMASKSPAGEYAPDTFERFLKQENPEVRPRPDYMDSQANSTGKMHATLID